jgi:hypothetical protein
MYCINVVANETCTVLFLAPKRQQLTTSIYCGVRNVVWNLNLAARGLKKIKIKVNFFPKTAIKELNSFQILILQGNMIFVIFLWFVLKNNDAIWSAYKRWEMWSRAPIFNGSSHTKSGHLWNNLISWLLLLWPLLYNKYLICIYFLFDICFVVRIEKQKNKHIFGNWRIVTNVLLNINPSPTKTSNANEYVRCLVATHFLSFAISNRKSYFV